MHTAACCCVHISCADAHIFFFWQPQFTTAFNKVAPDYPQGLIDSTFELFDPNEDGVIEFSELNALLRRREDYTEAQLQALKRLEVVAEHESQKNLNASPGSKKSSPASAKSSPKSGGGKLVVKKGDRSSWAPSGPIDHVLEAIHEKNALEIAELRALLARTAHMDAGVPAFRRVGAVATASLKKLDDGQRDDQAALRRRRKEEETKAAEETNRKPWDGSVWMYVPPALKGLKPVTPEPWARDGEAYKSGLESGHGFIRKPPKPDSRCAHVCSSATTARASYIVHACSSAARASPTFVTAVLILFI